MLGGLALGGMLGYLFAGNGLGRHPAARAARASRRSWCSGCCARRARGAAAHAVRRHDRDETVAAPPASQARRRLGRGHAARCWPSRRLRCRRLPARREDQLREAADRERRGQLDDIREFTTDEMFEELQDGHHASAAAQSSRPTSMALEADLLEVATEGDEHWASVRFSGRVRETPGTAPVGLRGGVEPGQARRRLERLAARRHPADALNGSRRARRRPPSGGLFHWRSTICSTPSRGRASAWRRSPARPSSCATPPLPALRFTILRGRTRGGRAASRRRRSTLHARSPTRSLGARRAARSTSLRAHRGGGQSRASRRRCCRSRATCAGMPRRTCRAWSATSPRTASAERRPRASPRGTLDAARAGWPRAFADYAIEEKRVLVAARRAWKRFAARGRAAARRARAAREADRAPWLGSCRLRCCASSRSACASACTSSCRAIREPRWCGCLCAAAPDEPRAARLRQALETLGPIFVKFGQVLSTRRDLLPLDIADELAQLQDRVPPFPSELAVAEIERSLGKPHRRGVRDASSASRRERLDRAGALRHAARRPRSRGQGAAPRRRGGDRARRGAARDRGRAGRAAVGRRPAPASRARWWPSSRAISTTSST